MSHRRDDQSEDYRRLGFEAFPEKRLIRVWTLQDAAAEKEMDDFMSDPDTGEMLKEGPTLLHKGDDVEFVTIQ